MRIRFRELWGESYGGVGGDTACGEGGFLIINHHHRAGSITHQTCAWGIVLVRPSRPDWGGRLDLGAMLAGLRLRTPAIRFESDIYPYPIDYK